MSHEGNDGSQRPPPSEAQRLGAEFTGTFLLTFVAAGADILDQVTPSGTIGHVARYVAPALLVMAMIYSLSAISGAHINPVVTLAFFARRCFPLKRLPSYISVQLLAAVAAALSLRALFGSAIELGVTKPKLGFTDVQAVVMETILTFVLVYTILATSEEKFTVGKNSAIAVAGVIALCGLAFSPVSGASMNPARSLGPMLASGQLAGAWIYLVGPVLGSLIAAGVVTLMHGPANEDQAEAAQGTRA